MNPQPGQTLIINCPLEGAPLARLCVRSAYEAGARDVQVNWSDDAVARARMELGSEEALTDHKPWQLRRYLDYAESEGGVCVLHLIADDPELYAGLDGNKISRVNAARRAFMEEWQEYTMNDRVQWSISAISSAPWAKKMFPELDTDAAIEALWQLIFDTCSVEPDYPWMDTPESAVFRHPGNRKWFALVTTVSRSKLGLPGQQPVDIVNLKCDPLLIGSLRMEPGFYPAYHMNKDNWITAALDGSAPDDTIRMLLEMSYAATAPKLRKKPRPSAACPLP